MWAAVAAVFALTGIVMLSGCQTCTEEDLEPDGRVMECFRKDIQFVEMFSASSKVQSTDKMRRRTPMCGKAQEAISCFYGCCDLPFRPGAASSDEDEGTQNVGDADTYVRDYTAYLAGTAAAMQCCLDDPCDSTDPCAEALENAEESR
jgi:hypothetical protein